MQLFAQGLVEGRSASIIRKVYSHNMGYVSLSDDLFSLRMKGAYARYNSPNVRDTEVESIMDSIAAKAASVCQSLGRFPIVRCVAGGAAEMVARGIAQKLRDGQKAVGGSSLPEWLRDKAAMHAPRSRSERGLGAGARAHVSVPGARGRYAGYY